MFRSGRARTVVASMLGACGLTLTMLAGCGGDEGSTVLSGRVVDGPVAGAVVCVDLNADFVCSGAEPSTVTDEQGFFQLETKLDVDRQVHWLVAEVGPQARDLDDAGLTLAQAGRLPFRLAAPLGAEVLSPFTTQALLSARSVADYPRALGELAAALRVDAAALASDFTRLPDAADKQRLAAMARAWSDHWGQRVQAAGALWAQGAAQTSASTTAALAVAEPQRKVALAAQVSAVCVDPRYLHLPVTARLEPATNVVGVGTSFRVSISGGNFSPADLPRFTVTSSSTAVTVATVTSSYAQLYAAREASAVTLTVRDARCPSFSTSVSVRVATVPQLKSINSASGRSYAGQPITTARKNTIKNYLLADHYPTRSNGADHAAAESLSTVTLTGINLGTSGTVLVSTPGIVVRKIRSWSPTAITFVLQSTNPEFTYDSAVSFSVRRSDGMMSQPLREAYGIAGMIATRAWGQCTWEVARTRLAAGRVVPDSGAYAGTAVIDSSWVPARWDAITFPETAGASRGHVGIITSDPQVRESRVGSTWIRTYTFTLTDRNANWDEALAATTQTFQVRLNRQGGTPTSMVTPLFRRGFVAYKYFR